MSEKRRGSALLEFALLGIPTLFVSISVVMTGLGMWQFHSMAYGTEATSRYIAMHGRTCTQNGNTCTITVGTIATYFAGRTLALDPAKVSVTLMSNSNTVSCAPLNSCNSRSDTFPSSADNGVKFDIVVTATYPVATPLTMFWPGSAGVQGSTFNLTATSRQMIVF